MTIGERIVFLREEREISQKELALALHITAATLSRYENDIYQPKLEFLCEMCRILNTSSDYMLGFTENFEVSAQIEQGTGTTQALSSEERKLLKLYRNLSAGNKLRVKERILTLLESQ